VSTSTRPGSARPSLAFRPREEVEAILDEHGMPAATDNSITDRETFLEELDEIREQRYAVDREEGLPGLRCIAVPITRRPRPGAGRHQRRLPEPARRRRAVLRSAPQSRFSARPTSSNWNTNHS